ncbi:hypothetical protein VKT23_006562 [Stygiomarasmius scandens]|uniref:Uncharacterized protein n=1 Tax=Marasmiellus scandens TaxID=2682957 RepID=A0ABR1JTW1_9AGAR
MNIPGLRQGILQVMNSLNKPDRTFSSQLRGYIYAQDWGNLASQVRRSKQSLMDEMVVIMHSSRVDFARPSFRPRRIVYDNLQDIPAILAGGRLPQHPSTRFPVLNPLAPAFIPSAAASHSVHVEHLDQQPNNETEAIADEAPEDDKNAEDHEERELANVVLGTTTEEPQIIEQTEDELRAIVRIQVAYRKHLARQRKSTNQHILTRDRFWQQCVRREPALPFGSYRLKMWGPLPHVWALLEFLYSRSQEEKSKTKNQMGLKMVLGPDELAKLDEALTRINSALKRVTSLQKSLTATSDLHKRRDGVKLAQLVVDLGTLIRQDLPFELPDDMHEEYRIGYKGIVQLRAPPRKPVKPELNTDDL